MPEQAVESLELDALAIAFGEGEALTVACGDAAALATARDRLRGQRRVALHVPETATLRLVLPRLPRSKTETRAMLGDLAPVAASELAWTQPQPRDEGGATIILVRRSWLDPRVAEIESVLGILPKVIVEPEGQPLVYQSPAQRRRNLVTGWIVGGSVAVAAIALSSAAARPPEQLTVSAPLSPWPSNGGAIAALAAVSEGVLPETSIAAVGADAQQELRVELLTRDPDALRESLSASRALRGYGETAHVREPNGGYRVTYRSRIAPGPVATRLAPVLTATSRQAAVQRVSALLMGQASSQVVQLRLGREAGAGEAVLRLPLDLVGPQGAVLGLVNRIESGQPPARLGEWRLQPDPNGVRLSGTLLVPWREPA